MSAKDLCRIFIGRLVSHPCGRPAGDACPKCQQPICALHKAPGGECVVCGGIHRPPAGVTRVDLDEMLSFTDKEFEVFDSPPDRPGRLMRSEDGADTVYDS